MYHGDKPRGSLRRHLKPLANRVEHHLLVRELAGLQLRVEQFAVDGQLETAAAAGNQFQVLDPLLVLGQELARQTDGFRLVASHRAILEFHVHGWLLFKMGQDDWSLPYNYTRPGCNP